MMKKRIESIQNKILNKVEENLNDSVSAMDLAVYSNIINSMRVSFEEQYGKMIDALMSIKKEGAENDDVSKND